MSLLSYVLQSFYSLTKVLMPQESQPCDAPEGLHVREALLLGLCLLRCGVLETRLYDAIVARSEGCPPGAGANRESAQQH